VPTKILGIPAHPLIIHAAVVFIPLLVVGAIVFAVWPAVRGRIDWAVGALAVIAPLVATAAVLSGNNLRQALVGNAPTSVLAVKITQHQAYGHDTLWFTIALGVVTLAVVGYSWQVKRAGGSEAVLVRVGGAVVTVVLAAFVGYYVFRTGDSGAHMVWGG
jgi:hypothetical protein